MLLIIAVIAGVVSLDRAGFWYVPRRRQTICVFALLKREGVAHGIVVARPRPLVPAGGAEGRTGDGVVNVAPYPRSNRPRGWRVKRFDGVKELVVTAGDAASGRRLMRCGVEVAYHDGAAPKAGEVLVHGEHQGVLVAGIVWRVQVGAQDRSAVGVVDGEILHAIVDFVVRRTNLEQRPLGDGDVGAIGLSVAGCLEAAKQTLEPLFVACRADATGHHLGDTRLLNAEGVGVVFSD